MIIKPKVGMWLGMFRGMGGSASPSGGVEYLINQNFEGTGYDNGETWTTDYGTPNPDYTTTVLRGSQSLYLSEAGIYSPSFTSSGTIYGHFLFRKSANPGTAQIIIADPNNGYFFIYMLTDTLKADHGSSENYGTYELANNTTYHVWFKYAKGTGSNGILQIWVGTTTNRADATLDINASDGSSTGNITQVQLSGNWISSIYDQILISQTEFTTVDA